MLRAMLGAVLFFVAACSQPQGEGERCNPAQYSSTPGQGDCQSGLTCVYPTAPNCGVAYCCKTDSNGAIVDKDSHCQFDPSLTSVCGLDGGSSD
jgi:hypothetical protein